MGTPKYRKFVSKVFEERGNVCQVQSEVCTHFGQGLHHLQKRSPKNLMVEKNVLVCCNACNLHIELNPNWAKEKGFTVSKFDKKWCA